MATMATRVAIETAQARAVPIAVAAKLLGVSENTVRRLIESDGLPVLRLGMCRVVPLAQLDRWIAARTEKTS